MSKGILDTDRPVGLLWVFYHLVQSVITTELVQYGVAMPEQHIPEMMENTGDLSFVMSGDFNARTGNENPDVEDACD